MYKANTDMEVKGEIHCNTMTVGDLIAHSQQWIDRSSRERATNATEDLSHTRDHTNLTHTGHPIQQQKNAHSF